MQTRFRARGLSAVAILLGLSLCARPGHSQDILKELEQGQSGHAAHGQPAHGQQGHDHSTMRPVEKKPAAKKKNAHAGHAPATAPSGATHDNANHGGHSEMRGFLGPYPMAREASGTSWQPDTTPHTGVHATYGEWQTMYHALLNFTYDHQGGPRGGNKTFASGMLMGMAQRPLGDGTFGLRAMLSPEPFMGPNGYPLLLATGETADGRSHLVDRQHPHELFMELAATYSYDIGKNSSVFLYAGLPGEPALGPPAFMHRLSGLDMPEAPITHHWLDSTHITFGVVTAGVVMNTWKFEASAFRGREPDQHRYDIEAPRLDSFSGRISWNPIRELSLQVSYGHLHSPEQLEPDRNEDRFTMSATYTQPFGKDNVWSTTAAWGRKMARPGDTLDGFILETAAIFKKTYTVFARAERVQANELVHDSIYTVDKVSVGGIYDFYRNGRAKFGIGGLVSVYGLPGDLKPLYGDPISAMAFLRLKIE